MCAFTSDCRTQLTSIKDVSPPFVDSVTKSLKVHEGLVDLPNNFVSNDKGPL